MMELMDKEQIYSEAKVDESLTKETEHAYMTCCQNENCRD